MASKRNRSANPKRKHHTRRRTPTRRAAAPPRVREKRRRGLESATPSAKARGRSDRRVPARAATPPMRAKVGFVFSNDPDPMLVERMRALEESGDFETHAIFWHRSGSDLSFPFTPAPLEIERFTQVNLPDPRAGLLSRCWLTFLFAWSIMKWVHRNDFRALHVVYPNMLIAAFIATVWRPVEIVYDVWDVNHSQSMSLVQRIVFRVLLSKTRQIFTTSQAFIDEFVVPNRITGRGTRITHVSNAPYPRRKPRPRPYEPIRKLHQPLVIGCVGNLRVPQQMQMLVEAVKRVRASGRDVRVRLSGAGSRRRMASAAATSNSFIEYTGPYDYQRDAAGLYSALDVVFAVYPLEIFNYRVHIARRLHDAVLSSTPIVVARGTHMAEIVEDQKIGWAIGHESVGDLVHLLQGLHDNRNRLVDRAQNASQVAVQHSFQAYREIYVRSYRRLLTHRLPKQEYRPTTPAATIPAPG